MLALSRSVLLGFLAVILTSRAALSAADGANVVLDQLLSPGIELSGQHAPLPAPTIRDGLDSAGQQAAIEGIADTNHPAAALLRKSVVAPFVLKISGGDGGAPVDALPSNTAANAVQHVDLWFIAYAQLDKLTDDDFWKSWQTGGDSNQAADSRDVQTAHSTVLTAEELRKRQIADSADQRHLAGEVTLFNQVRLSGTMLAMRSRTAESLVAAAVLDPRFADDAQYPNRWWSLGRDESGQLTVGPPQKYQAAGWYVKATQLHEPAGSLLVEFHLAFEEPYGWFHGENYLRSKLPIVAQDAVRKFRRHLSDSEVSKP